MPTLAIVFLIFLNLFSLSAQNSDRIELDRDIHYERNPRPDIPVPDIFLSSAYPDLADREQRLTAARMVPDVIREFSAQDPADAPAVPVLALPRVTSRAAGKNSGQGELSGAYRDGWQLSGDYLLENSSSSLFWLAASDWMESARPYGWAGYDYSGRIQAKLTAGGNWQEDPLWALSAQGEMGETSLVLQYWQDPEQTLFMPRLDTRLMLAGRTWTPYGGILSDAVFGESPEYRVRPSLGVLGRGDIGSGLSWKGEAGLALEYESFSQAFHYYGQGALALMAGESLTLKAFLEIEEPAPFSLMTLGISAAALPPLSPLTGQNSGILLAFNTSRWSGSLKTGYRWGSFLRYRDETFSIVDDSIPYGELELTKKRGRPVSDISLYAEYLNREEWQYGAENRWYFDEGRWSAAVKAGHFQSKLNSIFTPVAVSPFRTGVSALYRHGNLWQVEVFTDYLPEDSEIDGGITFRVTF